MAHVLDSSAVLAWLFQEPGAQTVDEVLHGSTLHTVNLAEVHRVCERRGYQRMDTLTPDLAAIGLRLDSDLPTAVAERAGALVHTSYGDKWGESVDEVCAERGVQRPGARQLSLGDGVCLAYAEHAGLPVMTADMPWLAAHRMYGLQVDVIR